MRRRITIVEDSRETQARLRKSVPPGVEMQLITAAPYFDERIARVITEFNPHLIVLDLSLMGNADSGFQILKRLKRSSPLRNIPVVLCSMCIGHSSPDKYENEARRWGAVAVIPKIPFPDFREFLKYANDVKEAQSVGRGLV